MDILLSICIPTYNRRDFLELCLDRVLSQLNDRRDIEILVVNNGSEDGTSALLAEQSAHYPQLRHIDRPNTVDISKQFFSTLFLGKGRWRVYLADDDKLDLDTILAHIEAMRDRDGVAAIYTDWIAWDDQREAELHRYFKIGAEKNFSLNQAPALLQYVLSESVLPEIAIYRGQCLNEALVATSGKTGNFYQLLLGLLKRGEIVFRDPAFYYECRVVKPHLKRSHWGNMDLQDNHFDSMRAALENFALGALRGISLTAQQRLTLYDGIQGFISGRMGLYRQRALGARKWREALRLDERIRLWFPQAALPIQSSGGNLGYVDLVLRAVVEAIADWADALPGYNKIHLVSSHLAMFENPIQQSLLEGPSVTLIVDLTASPIDSHALYVLHSEEDLQQFEAMGGARNSALVMTSLVDGLGNAVRVAIGDA